MRPPCARQSRSLAFQMLTETKLRRHRPIPDRWPGCFRRKRGNLRSSVTYWTDAVRPFRFNSAIQSRQRYLRSPGHSPGFSPVKRRQSYAGVRLGAQHPAPAPTSSGRKSPCARRLLDLTQYDPRDRLYYCFVIAELPHEEAATLTWSLRIPGSGGSFARSPRMRLRRWLTARVIFFQAFRRPNLLFQPVKSTEIDDMVLQHRCSSMRPSERARPDLIAS